MSRGAVSPDRARPRRRNDAGRARRGREGRCRAARGQSDVWNGEGLDRLLDADHAAIVELVARELRTLDVARWLVAVEVSFNIRGERWLDRHPGVPPARRGMLLVVEVKSVVPDVQATSVMLDRKVAARARDRRELGAGRGVAVGRILVVRDGRTSRRRVAAHEATFAAAFPAARRRRRSAGSAVPDPGRLSRASGFCQLNAAVERTAAASRRLERGPRA